MRHTIGWLNKPTKDGRVLTDISFREGPYACVTVMLPTGQFLGNAWDFKIAENGEISCHTDVPMVLHNEVLSLQLDGTLVEPAEDGLTYLEGELRYLALIPRDTWAWSGEYEHNPDFPDVDPATGDEAETDTDYIPRPDHYVPNWAHVEESDD